MAEYCRAIREKIVYEPSDIVLKHPEETVDVLSALSGDKFYKELYNKRKAQGKELNMTCRFLEERYQSGLKDGFAEGKLEGKIEGKIESARKFIAAGISLETIANGTDLPIETLKTMQI